MCREISEERIILLKDLLLTHKFKFICQDQIVGKTKVAYFPPVTLYFISNKSGIRHIVSSFKAAV